MLSVAGFDERRDRPTGPRPQHAEVGGLGVLVDVLQCIRAGTLPEF
jgi:hypothetical protein